MRRRAYVARRDEAGAIALIAALVSVVLLAVSAFVVDLGSTWARRGELQVQADHAALFAAELLPATSQADREAVAAQAAYYIACHPVPGQASLSTIPDCSSSTSPSDAAIVDYGKALLAGGQVSFPSATSVKVVTPAARIDFSFGKVVGVDDSVQRKTAVAAAYSPGDVVPIGLSMSCMLSAAHNLQAAGTTLSGVLPLNYMSVGPIGTKKVKTDWPADPVSSGAVTVGYQPLSATGTYQNVPTSLSLQGQGWGATLVDKQVRVWFALGTGDARTLVPADPNPLTALGMTTVAVPAAVYGTAGLWEVKVAVRPTPSVLDPDPAWTMSASHVEFDVTVPEATADLLGCGRTLKSPRDCRALISKTSCTNPGNEGNLLQNLQEGLDHGLTAQTGLLSADVPATVDGMLDAVTDPSVLFKCSNATDSGDHKDIGGNISTGQTPNCVHLEQGATDDKEFTDGFLGEPHATPTGGIVAGRLVCTSARPCDSSLHPPFDVSQLGLPGSYKINDDHFTDFVKGDTPLDAAMFFNLTTYLTPGLPVVTPDSRLDPALYSSQRFFWVPVMSTPVQDDGNQAGDYPILTFRPVFVTQNQPSGVPAVDMVLDLVDSWVRSLLGIDASDDHGILMNEADHTLRALRFMTIEPAALPAPGEGYAGPLSEYVGTGPKIIRLVR